MEGIEGKHWTTPFSCGMKASKPSIFIVDHLLVVGRKYLHTAL
jgi:hypothetical protein